MNLYHYWDDHIPMTYEYGIEILNYVELELPAGLERSKFERQRRNNILAEEAAEIFDDQISVQQKFPIFFLVLRQQRCLRTHSNLGFFQFFIASRVSLCRYGTKKEKLMINTLQFNLSVPTPYCLVVSWCKNRIRPRVP